MSDTIAIDKNETVVILHPVRGSKVHFHHGREVVCKAGETEIVIGPMRLSADATEPTQRYVRTNEKDELGRAIFKPEMPSVA